MIMITTSARSSCPSRSPSGTYVSRELLYICELHNMSLVGIIIIICIIRSSSRSSNSSSSSSRSSSIISTASSICSVSILSTVWFGLGLFRGDPRRSLLPGKTRSGARRGAEESEAAERAERRRQRSGKPPSSCFELFEDGIALQLCM